MQRIVYYLFRIFIGIFQFLPFWLLYIIASGFSFLLYHVVRYRRKVVWDNLTKSFPEKSEKELQKIAREFYRHLGDLLVESLKGFKISKKELLNQFDLKKPELLKSYYAQNKTVIALTGHYGNWEWGAMAGPLFLDQQMIAVYTPIKNPYINTYVKKSREHFGVQLVSTTAFPRLIQQYPIKSTLFLLAADQNPSNPKRSHWVNFLGRDTATLRSVRFAQMHNLPLVFMAICKIKKGHYEVRYKKITDSPNQYTDLELTQLFMSCLEEQIRKQPAYWLWSHKRWKHTKPNK